MVSIDQLTITARSFAPDQPMPREHSGEGGDVPPVLAISGVPDGSVELAVLCHDPDAPMPNGFTHWSLYGLPPTTSTVDQETPARVGPNSTGDHAYIGPNPPAGHGLHRYYFWVYALNVSVSGTPTREYFLTEYSGNVLEQNRIVGTYTRS